MITLFLIVIAGIFNACMDVLQFKFNGSIFKNWKNQKWIDPVKSHANKWKYVNGIWAGEKFFGSSTFLVFLTDFWHLCKFLMLLSISFAVVLYNPLINLYVDVFLMYCAFTVTFELFYSKILIRKL